MVSRGGHTGSSAPQGLSYCVAKTNPLPPAKIYHRQVKEEEPKVQGSVQAFTKMERNSAGHQKAVPWQTIASAHRS